MECTRMYPNVPEIARPQLVQNKSKQKPGHNILLYLKWTFYNEIVKNYNHRLFIIYSWLISINLVTQHYRVMSIVMLNIHVHTHRCDMAEQYWKRR